MGTGAERQTRIQHHVDGVFIGHFTPAWADPQTLTKLHRMEVVHPLAFPVFVFQLFNFMRETRAKQRMVFQNRHDLFHIGFCIEQADNVRITPQARFARSGSKTGVSCVSRKVIETEPASISASLSSSAFAPVVFSFN